MTLAQDSAGGAVSRRDPTVRKIAQAWRHLTGGGRDRDHERRTLIACSGGGDSSGLVFALAAALSRPGEVLVVGHVVHDMRPRADAQADRDAAKALAERLGLKYAEAEVSVRAERGNAESVARRLRYGALERIAVAEGCGFVAVAHHAEDQIETMLMALVRGTGPRGLAGIAPSRRAGRVKVIRPALGVGREDMRELCRAAGWQWREDATNLDETRLRSAIRHRVVPELERLRPGAARRASRGAELVRGAAGEVRKRAGVLERSADADGAFAWKRADLRSESSVVLGELVRECAKKLRGARGHDRLSAAAVGRVVRAIRDQSTEPRVFGIGGIEVKVTSRSVKMEKIRG